MKQKLKHRTPLHLQLKEIILNKIEAGTYKPGELIPSERELADHYVLNRMTVRGAIGALVAEGFLKRVQGKGTFVIKQKIFRDLNFLQGFSRTMKVRGITPTSKVLATHIIDNSRTLQEKLNLTPEQSVFRISRLRFGDDLPIALEDTYVPYQLIPDIKSIDFNVFSLYEAYVHCGIQLKEATQTLTVVKVNNPIARMLKISEQSSVFLFECVSYDGNDQIVEFTKSYTRGDNCCFYTELV